MQQQENCIFVLCAHVKILNLIRSLWHINVNINPITLFSVDVNTMFGFINRNEFIQIETKRVHVNVAIVISITEMSFRFHRQAHASCVSISSSALHTVSILSKEVHLFLPSEHFAYIWFHQTSGRPLRSHNYHLALCVCTVWICIWLRKPLIATAT